MATDRFDDRLKAISKVAFGQEYRLPLMIAILEAKGERVTQSGLAKRLSVTDSSIHQAFKDLVEIGLLVHQPEKGQRMRFHHAVDSFAWQWAEELAKSVDDE